MNPYRQHRPNCLSLFIFFKRAIHAEQSEASYGLIYKSQYRLNAPNGNFIVVFISFLCFQLQHDDKYSVYVNDLNVR